MWNRKICQFCVANDIISMPSPYGWNETRTKLQRSGWKFSGRCITSHHWQQEGTTVDIDDVTQETFTKAT